MKAKLTLLKGDITKLKVDAIVNAANTSLLGGGGIDGAIHGAAGPELLAECEKLGGCFIGHAKLTKGYALPAKYVIHTVGPVWRGGAKGEPQLLAACYESTLALALKQNIKTIAFPAISCGIYGYPPSQAATIAIKETANFLELHPDIDAVYFVCFDDAIYDAYEHVLSSLPHE
ncbi:MAG TPA: O-acetyl-ADP-ribose deacetylase [Gammaproteobacteria bacterium]|nr:O-acetyl-ADP-ribose deacetylase [Gammaproteobacteria bacterium]